MGLLSRAIDKVLREIRFLRGALAAQKVAKSMMGETGGVIPDDFESVIDKHPNNVAFVFEGAVLTYREFDQRANRFAHWAKAQGLKRGEVVALLMPNHPDYIACWYGLSKLGIVSALLNTNLVGAGLAHCIRISGAKLLIVDSECAEGARSLTGNLTDMPPVWSAHGPVEGLAAPAQDLEPALQAASKERPEKSERAGIKRADTALLIYTSGTTGMPKAAKITHLRGQGILKVFGASYHLRPSDRLYLVLPLYHGTGGLAGAGAALTRGAAIILRRKFSATHFWTDCVQHGATVFIYIGELCRYLLNQPAHPDETRHRLRLIFGNGMRPDVWERFQPRFKIPFVGEFYGATEGNILLINFDGKMGALGRIPSYFKSRLPVRIVRTDLEKGEPLRGADGLCREAAFGEAGEVIGEIRADMNRQRFDGYAGDEAQTRKKIARDVFAKGDVWFRSGDLMRRDSDGYFYFVDRLGDTFRWKGENVSTSEVAGVLAGYPGILEANVYGVALPGMEGKAGMAAIVAQDLDFAALHDHVVRNLPYYARPLFLRLMPEIEITGTFKYRKTDLVGQGYDPAQITERILFDNPETGTYVPLDSALYARIAAGAMRL